MLWILLLLFGLLGLPHVSLAATYYLSPSGSGTACSAAVPCGNYQTAWQKLTPGDTLYFKGGTYGVLNITNMTGPVGTAANPITMTSAPGEMATIGGMGFNIYADASGCAGVCEIAYIIVDRVTITGEGFGVNSYHPFDVVTPGVHHITLQNSEVHHANPQGVSFFGHTGHHNTLRNNLIHHNGTDTFKDHGFYGNDHSDVLIEGNTFYSNAAYGLQVWVASGAGPVAQRYTIRNNILRDNGYGGLTLSHIKDSQVYNNLVYTNGFGPTPGGGGISISYGSPTGMRLWNNTITGNNGPCIILGSIADGSTVASPHVINNICYTNSGGIASGSNESVSSPTYTTNLCGAAGTACHVIGDPKFDNAAGGVFTLQGGSPARNAGTTLTAFNTDYALVNRPQGSGWDIGAYEYPEAGGLPPSGNPLYLSAGGHGDSPTDSGDCTVPENILTPRATLAKALECLQIPGKHLRIRGGTYTGVIDTSSGAILGGSAADNPTTIEAYTPAGGPAEVVTIQMASGSFAGLLVNGIDFFTIDGLIVDALNCPDCNAMGCLNSGNVTIRNSTFRKSFYEAGYLSGCPNLLIAKSKFQDGGTGGFPVVALDGTMTSVTLDEVEVSNGPAQGIAVNVSGGSNSSLSITRSQIRTTGTSGSDAALDLANSTGATLVNNIVQNNHAGIRVRSTVSGAKIYHNAVASNMPGVGIQCDAGASGVSISNNISFGNGADSVVNNCGAMIANTMTTDPQWVNVAACDFHLQSTSPAMDALSPPPLPEATIAIDGTTRPQGSLVDLGPHEQSRPGAPTAPTTAVQIITRYLGMFF